MLADRLADVAGDDAVVVGLARGGVVVAAEVARRLGLPLDALAARKIGHPMQPEYAIGAVTPGEGLLLRTQAQQELSPDEIDAAVMTARRAAEELDRRLHERRPPADVAGRTCLLVDDGLATGATMIAAVRWARQAAARRVVVAVPVGAGPTVELLCEEADDVVCLEIPARMVAVGAAYDDFSQVSDDQVIALLDGQEGQSPAAR
jgi:putative phosphoribosyl transferase